MTGTSRARLRSHDRTRSHGQSRPLRRSHGPATARFAFGLALVLAAASLAAQDYPRIGSLSNDDPVFMQYCDDVAFARRALAAAKPGGDLPIRLYSYVPARGDMLLTVAARCSVPYDAIASLNRLPSAIDGLPARPIVLPTLPGVYLPDSSANDFERLLLSSFDPDDPTIVTFTVRDPAPRSVHCLPDSTFDGTVRAFFLTPTFRFPLPTAVQTSSFGMRKNPVTGNLVFHHGVDLAASRGTPVYACADGEVTATGTDPTYGNYVIIRHASSRESLYGHLDSVKIVLRQKVKSGSIIGTVGSTGQSTGPHLHFEIHENGVPKNPSGFIKGS